MKNLFILLIIFIFYSGTVNLGNEYFLTYGRWVYITAIFSIVFTYFNFLAYKNMEIRYNKSHVLLFLLFLMTNLITALINAEIELMIFSISFFVIFLTLNLIIPAIFGQITISMVNKVFLIVHIPIILIPLYMDGLKSFPYYGGFFNENSMGLTASIVLILTFSTILKKLETYLIQNKINMLVILALSIFSMILIIIVASSGSRTSFITSLIVFIIGLILFLKNMFKEIKKRRKYFVKIIFRITISIPPIVLVVYLINKVFPLFYYIEENVLSKFTRQVEKGRLLSGRENIWKQTIQEASLFGNGSDYFLENIGKGAHNTFIHILGVYGWASIILFLFIIFVFGVNAYSFYQKQNDTNRYIPILMFIAFVGLSMAENLMHNILFFLIFIYIGVISKGNLLIIKR